MTILPVARTDPPVLEQMLEYGEPLRAVDFGSAHLLAMGASILIATVGIGLGVLYYGPWVGLAAARRREDRPSGSGPIYRFLVHKWYFDELYQAPAGEADALALARRVGVRPQGGRRRGQRRRAA